MPSANPMENDPKKDIVTNLTEQIVEKFPKLSPDEQAFIYKTVIGESQNLKKQNSTYYKKRFGIQIKPDIMHMIETGAPLLFEKSLVKWKLKTLYQYITDAINYLADNDEQIKAYKPYIRKKILKGRGVLVTTVDIITANQSDTLIATRLDKDTFQKLLKENPKLGEDSDDLPTLMDDTVDANLGSEPEWKKDLFDYVEKAKLGDPFVRENIKLTESEYNELIQLFSGEDNPFGLVIKKDRTGFTVRKIS